MEHTVFFMYIYGIYVKKFKKRIWIFFGSIGIRTRIAQGIADMRFAGDFTLAKYAQWPIAFKMVQTYLNAPKRHVWIDKKCPH